MLVIHHNACPVCGSQKLRFVLKAEDHTVSGEIFSIYECANCSLRFTQDVPDNVSIGAYYQSADYISHAGEPKGFINWLYRKVRNRNVRKKRKLIEKFSKGKKGKILDVGAGIGSFLHEMQAEGWEAKGIEPSVSAREVAKKKYGFSLEKENSLFEMAAGSFDAITLWHVLEHVHDLHGYLRQIKVLLKETGRIFIALPNYQSMDAKAFRENWAAYDVPRHLYHFSSRSMDILMKKHDLKILQLQPMWFDSFYISLLSTRYKKGRNNLLLGFWNGFVSDLNAIGNVEKCSSVIYIISK